MDRILQHPENAMLSLTKRSIRGIFVLTFKVNGPNAVCLHTHGNKLFFYYNDAVEQLGGIPGPYARVDFVLTFKVYGPNAVFVQPWNKPIFLSQ